MPAATASAAGIGVPPTLRIRRRWKIRAPNAYLAHAGTARAVGGDDPVVPSQRPFEFMLNALRLREGFELSQFEVRTGLPRAVLARPLAQAQGRGWLAEVGGRTTPTELGQRFLNDVIALFLPDTPRAPRQGATDA